jgi:UDP-glucose 4-epimerase
MNVLVTGATGFVGGPTMRTFLGDGWAVRALVRRDAAILDGCTAVRGDLRDEASLARATEGIDVVVHAAAQLDPIPDEGLAIAVNRRATAALAHAARDRGARAFVFVSSIAAIDPTTAYGRSKRGAEDDLLGGSFAPMRIAVVRAPTVYGPGERRNFLALTRAIAAGRFFVPGPGTNRMPLCHVDSLARALSVCVAKAEATGVLYVADTPPATLREIATAIGDALGRRLAPISLPMPFARAAAGALEAAGRIVGRAPPLTRARLATLTADVVFDTAPLSALGWRPARTLADGVTETVAWYRSQGLV